MTNSQYFFVNGQEYSINFKLTLLQMINYFNYDTSLFVLEYNDQICNQKNWKNIYIHNQDKIEIVTIVGGG